MNVVWSAPWGLALGAVVVAGLVALHAITVGRPRPVVLPTARFAPERAPRAARRLARPADRALLALRVLAAGLAAVALARPVREPARRRVARVVLADVSGTGAAREAVRDRVRTLVGAGDVLVAYGATPHVPLITAALTDSAALRGAVDSALDANTAGVALRPASLSAALVAARRVAAPVAAGADSLELVVVSAFPREAADAATPAVRGVWSGRARLVRVGGAVDEAPPPAPARPTMPRAAGLVVALRGGPADDALAAGLALAGVRADAGAPVRVLRGAPTGPPPNGAPPNSLPSNGTPGDADRAWAAEPGHVLVVWPAEGGGRPPVGAEGVVAAGRAAVGAFGRVAVDAAVDATGATDGAAVRVVARWADGVPAAAEQAVGAGCVRTVGVRVPQAGDAALRPAFRALLPTLLGPCGVPRDTTPLAAADLARLAGDGPLLAAAPLRARQSSRARDPFGAVLLALAAVLLVAEWPLRRVLARGTTGADEGIAAAGAAGATRVPNGSRVAA